MAKKINHASCSNNEIIPRWIQSIKIQKIGRYQIESLGFGPVCYISHLRLVQQTKAHSIPWLISFDLMQCILFLFGKLGKASFHTFIIFDGGLQSFVTYIHHFSRGEREKYNVFSTLIFRLV